MYNNTIMLSSMVQWLFHWIFHAISIPFTHLLVCPRVILDTCGDAYVFHDLIFPSRHIIFLFQ